MLETYPTVKGHFFWHKNGYGASYRVCIVRLPYDKFVVYLTNHKYVYCDTTFPRVYQDFKSLAAEWDMTFPGSHRRIKDYDDFMACARSREEY